MNREYELRLYNVIEKLENTIETYELVIQELRAQVSELRGIKNPAWELSRKPSGGFNENSEIKVDSSSDYIEF